MTIKEIAQLAGVSRAAVSRYLNGGYISEEKKTKIRRVVEETGYQPSVQARNLRTKRACLIGVVVPKINSESISRITAGIGQVLSSRGYQMLLASTDNQAEKEIEYLKLFENYPVDGIVLVGTMITGKHKKFLTDAKVPVVVVGQYTKYANCIYHDDYGAGKEMGRVAAEHIKKQAHKDDEVGHIAYIGVTREDKAAGAAREDGFRAGLRAAGYEMEDDYVRTAKFSMESGYRTALSLLEEKTDIDIISCATDTIAAGAIKAVHVYNKELESGKEKMDSRGRRASSVAAVTGFGDNQLLKAVTGGIPTIHFGYKTSGIRGAELLLDVIERGEKIPVEIKLGFCLVNGDAES